MPKHFIAPTTYFLQEGRGNLEDCLKTAFQAANQHNIQKIIIFTSQGEGVKLANQLFLSQPEYSHVQLIAVTFPAGKQFTDSEQKPFNVEISPDDLRTFVERQIPVVRAHLPFDPIAPGIRQRGVLGQDLSLLGDALNLFCGSMSLCVQSVLLACDAGHVQPGEHVISLTSDTAILATAAPTRYMLSQMVIREILCKPVILTIGRSESAPLLAEEIKEPEQISDHPTKRLKSTKKNRLSQ